MKKLILSSITIAIICTSSCKKNDETTEAAVSAKTTFLTSSAWKAQKSEVQSTGSTTWTDVTSSNPACKFNDILKYNTDFQLVIDEGATKCSASDPQTTTSAWSFQSNETILNAGGQLGEISVLDANNLVVIYSQAGITKVRNTFKH
jgi:hypothetical protein